VLVFWSKSLVFHGESAGWCKWQKFFEGKVLDGPRGKASLEERLLHFKVLVFWAKCLDVFGIPWRNAGWI